MAGVGICDCGDQVWSREEGAVTRALVAAEVVVNRPRARLTRSAWLVNGVAEVAPGRLDEELARLRVPRVRHPIAVRPAKTLVDSDSRSRICRTAAITSSVLD